MKWAAIGLLLMGIASVFFLLQRNGPITAPATSDSEVQTPVESPIAPSQKSVPNPAAARILLWGAYVGDDVANGDAFERLVGASMKTRAIFVHWGNNKEFPKVLAAEVKKKGETLVIFWESMDYEVDTTSQPRFSASSIAKGDWDAYIASFAATAKAYGAPVILIPFEEMNGNWYPWAGTVNGNSPEGVIAAYRHIHDLFSGVSNVKFGWDINEDSVPDTAANVASAYYPGDDVVDYVGVDGFNDAEPWRGFSDIFSGPLELLSRYDKPIFIFSFASAEGPQKAAWIREALSAIKEDKRIIGWLWFNENKEKDWRVNSSPSSLDAFRSSL